MRKKTPEKADKPLLRRQGKAKKEKLVGKVDHYFDKIKVAALRLKDSLKVGDTVRIEGGTLSFTQEIASLQIDHEQVKTAKKGSEVGFKVKKKVREGYRIFKT